MKNKRLYSVSRRMMRMELSNVYIMRELHENLDEEMPVLEKLYGDFRKFHKAVKGDALKNCLPSDRYGVSSRKYPLRNAVKNLFYQNAAKDGEYVRYDFARDGALEKVTVKDGRVIAEILDSDSFDSICVDYREGIDRVRFEKDGKVLASMYFEIKELDFLLCAYSLDPDALLKSIA